MQELREAANSLYPISGRTFQETSQLLKYLIAAAQKQITGSKIFYEGVQFRGGTHHRPHGQNNAKEILLGAAVLHKLC